MRKELAKHYDPAQSEERLYKFWQDNGYFRAEVDKTKKPYTIVIPPPNVTGQLHMGHALDQTIQDILIRVKRMQGYSALWQPGTDHAGIATQIKVEEMLRVEEGLSKHDLGREKFLERVWEWKEKYGDIITNQLKKLGSSCDWERERFTMDEGCSRAVREVFVNLYDKGLIYQGNRIINWCPSCVTALSDAEVEYSESEGHFWHIKYPIADNPNEFITIATTRPETMLGDTAVAVNPNDERYSHLVGKTLILPLVGREIPIIADEYVESEFGTGCVKITPAHDPNDFEIGLRHNLEQIRVMDDNAVINKFGGKYEGLERYEARKQIVADLEAQGLLAEIETHTRNVGGCYRCGTTVEPITSKQWFVKMEPLAKPAVDAVKGEIVKFVPDRFSKIYLNWMENVHDWCISRQLWWGHRIPAFYCDDCDETIVAKEDVTSCPKCGGKVRQDDDVLDTWFSSALWPFSTLGYPDKTPELEYFYPTSVLVTGYDIIFFWVARMIFSGLEHMGEKPFDDVFIHGIVRDSQGRKMSKSLGNGIDPLGIISQYGADALRFTLATGNSPGNDMRFHTERVEASRNFANKIWNASRFIMMNLGEQWTMDNGQWTMMEDFPVGKINELQQEDKWILHKLNELTEEITRNIDKYELGIALEKLYNFIWDDFCSWYIELVKPRLRDEGESNVVAQQVLTFAWSNTMKLLHPFMPFITEEIWQTLHNTQSESIMVSEFPKFDEKLVFKQAAAEMEAKMEEIRVERNAKAAAQDAEQEFARLTKEKSRLEGEVKRAEGKLSNKGFTDKAPASVIEEEREKLAKYKEMLEKTIDSLAKMK